MHKLQFSLQITTFVKEMKALRKIVDGMAAVIVSLKTRYNDKTYQLVRRQTFILLSDYFRYYFCLYVNIYCLYPICIVKIINFGCHII